MSPKLPKCPACAAPPGGGCRGPHGTHEARYALWFLELARRLEERRGAPSLDGYDLAPGLSAAAHLLMGKPGPNVHPDLSPGTDAFRPYVTLAAFAAEPDGSEHR